MNTIIIIKFFILQGRSGPEKHKINLMWPECHKFCLSNFESVLYCLAALYEFCKELDTRGTPGDVPCAAPPQAVADAGRLEKRLTTIKRSLVTIESLVNLTQKVLNLE